MTTWKAVERAVARLLGGERVGCTGKATPDVVTERLAVEVKHRAKLPKWLMAAMEQSERNAPEDKVPVVVLHEKHQKHCQDLVILRLAHFGSKSAGGQGGITLPDP